ncbi:hypothetical protein BN2476_750156 [Paraburkholderia piptadeniae]|uniref:Uncharacterized protein n=1 Tax=Paraburkholderia piptadeniae TaxID=1701573 RepID=A0A1N7SS26_9BURK|nr:hypothetical protein BN2476_750156 [Paraburkholderia piptadeniae]
MREYKEMGRGGLAVGPRMAPVEGSAHLEERESPERIEDRASHGGAFDVQPYLRACSTWAMTARVRASTRWADSRVSTSHRDRA